MNQYRCPICGYIAEFEGEMPADYVCPQCKCPGERFEKLGGANEPVEEGWAAEHVVGVGKLENVPADMARRAKAANLDAIHDTVHEMARDEARHGRAFEGLLKRYFG